MATTTKTKAAAKTSRYNELRKMLEERRRELMTSVQGKMRDVRAEGGKDRDVLDQGESSEVDIQEDIEFALIQMKSETLNGTNIPTSWVVTCATLVSVRWAGGWLEPGHRLKTSSR